MRTLWVQTDLYGPLPMEQIFYPTTLLNNPIRMEMDTVTIRLEQMVMLALHNQEHRAIDRNGCPDSDSDGVSDPDATWTVLHGADAFPSDATQSADTDGDGYGDNASGTNPDGCPTQYGDSTIDRIGCPDSDGDGISDADGLWNVSQGADAFRYDATQSLTAMVMDMVIMQVEIIRMHAHLNSVILGKTVRLDAQTLTKMDGLIPKIHILTTYLNGPMWMEMDTVTIQVEQHQTPAQEMMGIQQRATDTVALTPMVMVGMTSSTNYLV